MKKAKPRSFWRIKDLETGLYFNKELVLVNPQAESYYSKYSKWDNFGFIWTNKGAAEAWLTKLTHTSKKNRDTEAKIILYGNKETAKLRIVEALVQDKKSQED